jgi:hypothetical protein
MELECWEGGVGGISNLGVNVCRIFWIPNCQLFLDMDYSTFSSVA